MRKRKFTESQIIKAIKANENGQRVEDLCRELGIRPATFYGGERGTRTFSCIALKINS